MQLRWEHDGEDWDPFTILGRVTLRGDVGGEIHDDCLILDSWLLGLARGLIELRAGASKSSIDTIDEPNVIQLQKRDSGFTVSWMDQHTEITDIDQACSLLASQLRALTTDLRQHDPPRDENAIRELDKQSKELANKAWMDNPLPRRESEIES